MCYECSTETGPHQCSTLFPSMGLSNYDKPILPSCFSYANFYLHLCELNIYLWSLFSICIFNTKKSSLNNSCRETLTNTQSTNQAVDLWTVFQQWLLPPCQPILLTHLKIPLPSYLNNVWNVYDKFNANKFK